MADELLQLNNRLVEAEKKLSDLENRLCTERVRSDVLKKGIYTATFTCVPPNYYELTLQERAEILGASSASQLCKSIIFENVLVDHFNCDDPLDSRYYCVIVQYEAKIDTDLLSNVVNSLRPIMNRKKFNFQLAPEAISDRLTGFSHNAVSPFGLRFNLPMIICQRCLQVKPAYIYLGGGQVDVKLGISTADFLKATGAIVGELSVPR